MQAKNDSIRSDLILSNGKSYKVDKIGFGLLNRFVLYILFLSSGCCCSTAEVEAVLLEAISLRSIFATKKNCATRTEAAVSLVYFSRAAYRKHYTVVFTVF